jgi:predicted DNA binding CopG/RHH family protein
MNAKDLNLKMLCVRVPEELHHKLKSKALENKMPLQEFLKMLITKALEK